MRVSSSPDPCPALATPSKPSPWARPTIRTYPRPELMPTSQPADPTRCLIAVTVAVARLVAVAGLGVDGRDDPVLGQVSLTMWMRPSLPSSTSWPAS